MHHVVGVAGSDIEDRGQRPVVECPSVVGHTGSHELVRRHVLAGDVNLPRDELGGLLGLELPPSEIVLRLCVSVRGPQIRPCGQSVRPVDEAPLLIQALDIAVALPKPIDKALEYTMVVQQLVAGLVVDLNANHAGVCCVTREDLAHHTLGVEAECRVGEVDFLPGAPTDPLTGGSLSRDLWIDPGEPRWHRVGRSSKDYANTTLMRAVKHRQQPLKIERPVLRLPRGPDGLPHPDHRERSFRHQVEVCFQPINPLVFVVVGRTEPHTRRLVVHDVGSPQCVWANCGLRAAHQSPRRAVLVAALGDSSAGTPVNEGGGAFHQVEQMTYLRSLL